MIFTMKNNVSQLIERINKLAADPSRIHFMGSIFPRRPGVIGFSVFLEYLFFPPFNPTREEDKQTLLKAGFRSNDEYDLTQIEWGDMVFSVISIPKDMEKKAKELATHCGLEIKKNQIPFVIGGGIQGTIPFPDYTNVYQLVNTHGHFVYKNNPTEIAEQLKHEDVACDKIFNDFENGTLFPNVTMVSPQSTRTN